MTADSLTKGRNAALRVAAEDTHVSRRASDESVRRTIYVLPRHATSWSELMPLAVRLKELAGYRVRIVLGNEFAAARRDECERVGLEYVDVFDTFRRRAAGLLGRIVTWCTENHRWLAELLPFTILRYLQLRRQLRYERNVFKRLLATDGVGCVLLPGDRELSPVPSMIGACKDLGVPTVIAASNNPYIESLQQSRAEGKRFRPDMSVFPSLLNIVAAARYPRQVFESKGYGRLLFSPGWVTLALGAEGILSENPWTQGGGRSDFMLVPSWSKRDAYVDLGVPADKMLVVGSIEFDRLYESFERRKKSRADLFDQYKFRADRPFVVMAVPNDAEHEFCDWPTHLARQEQFWRELARNDVNVLLCLHPKSNMSSYGGLASKCGFAITERPLVECLPAADLFVCSLSTTLYWARCCGVPAINMNYFGLDTSIFRLDAGYYEAGDLDGFRACVNQAIEDLNTQSDETRMRYADSFARDYLFDGRAFERISNVLEKMVVYV